MKRNFQHDLVKVKNKQFFGAAQNIKLLFKNIFITNLIMVYYIEPFFSLWEKEDFNIFILGQDAYFVTNSLEEELEIFKGCRQEIKINNKIIYFVINYQASSYIHLEDEKDYHCYAPFYSSLGFLSRLNTSKSFDNKYKDFCMEFFKGSFLKDNRLLAHKFKVQLEANKGDYNNIQESLVNHISKEIELNLSPFFEEEDLNELIFHFSNYPYSKKGVGYKTDFLKEDFITDLEEYKEFLLNFYGEKGNFCKYTNVDKPFINNFKSKEELMYVDMVLGGKFVAEGFPRLGYYPFEDCLHASGWIIIKNLVEKLKQLK